MKPVAIVGGGPVGLALALALHRRGVSAEIFEARSRQATRGDARVLALSHGTRQVLEWLGVWSAIEQTPIAAIHISQRGGLGRTVLRAGELGVPALGYVAEAPSLIGALDAAAEREKIPYHEDRRISRAAELGAPLVAWAEGAVGPGDDGVRVRDYGQQAVICTATTAGPHGGMAWERFTDEGPVALLPLAGSFAVVLTCAADEAERVAALDDGDFLAVLQRRFGDRHRFLSATPRRRFPLALRYREQPVGERQVWLGNAAQTLHPVAGQGFNLALRDAWELAAAIAPGDDPGDAARLAAYARGRRGDRRGAVAFTEFLVDAFDLRSAPARHARGAGLLAMDLLPPLRAFVARRMMYGARAWP